MTNRRPTTARLLAGLAPFLLVGLSLPLLAPSCGDFQPGVKTFSKGSLIIPMDVCYQCTRQAADGVDTATASCTKTNWASTPSGNTCPQALQQGDVIKAYGLVYQLIRADVAVYWVIDPAKAALDGYDLAIQYAGGFPVLKLDWTSGQGSTPPTTAPGGAIRYMGGPFVIDGSDAAKAIAVMKANQANFGTVNVHVSSVAFQASVSKTMAGGWSAGGAVAPKLALLDIGSGNLSTRTTAPSSVCGGSGSPTCVKDPSGTSWTCMSDPKNAQPVISGYLAAAGIGSGASAGTSAGPHGQIYDRLTLADFQPAAGSTDWKTSAFGKGGYQILWVPHWVAPGSCSDYSSSCNCLATRYTTAQIDQVLKTVGAFSAAGGDVFAECAGMGSFEGAFSGLTGTSYTTDYQDGDPTTRFVTKTGVRYNQLPTNPFPTPSFTPDGVVNFASPLMQLGDFPFKPYTGAIEDYKPDDTTAADRNYQPGVARLIGTKYASGSPSVSRDWDFFDFRDRTAAHGSIVYLAGHSYSGVQGSFQAAGSRLVLNTLFNLGAGCTASGVSCDTGLPGACGKGVLTCDASGQRVCTPSVLPKPACAGVTAPVLPDGTVCETCNGQDDDCDGLVDEGLETACYSGPAGTAGVGQCRAGVQSCQVNTDGSYGFSACQGEVLPTAETCNGLDDDCNGQVDDMGRDAGGQVLPLSEACYSGPAGTAGVGICQAGTRTCANGAWGGCVGEVTPAPNPCVGVENGAPALDRDCNGAIDACSDCTPGATRDCFDGPSAAVIKAPGNTSICQHGVQTCNASGQWGAECVGEVLPQPEICRNGIDENCNGLTDDQPPFCMSCQFVGLATDPSKPDPARTEKLSCWTGPDASTIVFAGPGNASVCKQGFQFCQADGTFGACEQQVLPGPELCNGKDDNCNGTVDEGAECGAGFACQNGVCVESSCDGVERLCREGYLCFNGQCVVTGCGSGGACAPGNACNGGSCADPCDPAAIKCGTGSTCAGGYCTGGACYAVGCPAGELCQNGACVADKCAGVICPAGTFCRTGDCVQACAIVTCGASEKCSADGFCVPDPCAGKTCSPTQRCVDGTCKADACVGVACGAGQRCLDGVCLDDPCAGVDCPVGECRDGQCFAATRAVSAPTAPASSSGCGCGSGEGSPLALLGILLALPLARRRRRARGAAGLAVLAAVGLAASGCSSSKSAPFDPTACAAAAPPLATCEGEARCIDFSTDPSHCGGCGQACGAGNTCVPGVTSGQCAPASQVAPFISAISPPSGSVGALSAIDLLLSGSRFQAGASLRATSPTNATTTVATAKQADGRLLAHLDLSAAAPGTWQLRVVNPDNVISNSVGFGVTIPTPVITSVVAIPDAGAGSVPAKVAAGGPATLRLVGSGLMIDSACWIGGSTLLDQAVPATLTAAGLECRVDLSTVQPGSYQVWVVNDASHVSARSPFVVVSAAPVLDSISPSVSKAVPLSVQLAGSGFDITSKAWFAGPGFEQAQNTTFVDSTRLVVAALDLTHCPSVPCVAGNTYTLQVRNGAAASATKTLAISTTDVSVTSIAPQTAFQGDQPRVTISGVNLPAGTVLEYRLPGASAFQDGASPQYAATAVSGIVNLVGSPTGTCDVRLRFGAAGAPVSASFGLRVDSNQAVITTTPSPAGAAAGTTVVVTLTVANLRPPLSGVTVRLFDPAGPTSVAPTGITFPQAGQLAATFSLAGLETKVYAIAVTNPNGALESLPYNFTVLPGLPTLTAATCTNVKPSPPGCVDAHSANQQGTPIPLRLDGANFAKPDAAGNNGSVIHVYSGCTPQVTVVGGANVVTCPCQSPPPAGQICMPDFVISSGVTVVSPTEIDVAFDTLSAVPATYSVWVWNPGGAPHPQLSNRLTNAFTILP